MKGKGLELFILKFSRKETLLSVIIESWVRKLKWNFALTVAVELRLKANCHGKPSSYLLMEFEQHKGTVSQKRCQKSILRDALDHNYELLRPVKKFFDCPVLKLQLVKLTFYRSKNALTHGPRPRLNLISGAGFILFDRDSVCPRSRIVICGQPPCCMRSAHRGF
jgi:hypothetical protein